MVFAQAKGVTHRDIKPDNIMITADNQVLVADFGIATLAHAEEPEEQEEEPKFEIACTPKYAAPEQLTGDNVDQRSDIYSFGIVAYEMLAGHAPFAGRTLTEIAHKQLAMKPHPHRCA